MKKMILAAALGTSMLGGGAGAQTSAETTAAANNAAAATEAPVPAAPAAPHMRYRGRGGRGIDAGMIAQADLNHDGVITRAEASAAADQRFAAMDANGDGTVTRDERHDGMTAGRAAGRQRAGKDAPRAGREQTPAAFRDRALALFDRVDTNHNGQVDKNEIDAAKLVMRARMAGRRGGAMPPAPPAGDASDDQ